VFRGLAVASVLQGFHLELLVALVCGAALLWCHGGALRFEPLLEALVGAAVFFFVVPAAIGDAAIERAEVGVRAWFGSSVSSVECHGGRLLC